jgi:hypothetical protein
LAELGDHPLQQAGGNDFAAPQRHKALDDQRDGNDRRQQQGPDRPTSSLNDGKHVFLREIFQTGTLACGGRLQQALHWFFKRLLP